MANSVLTATSLDFDTYKASLKTFLKSQARFKDYNFDGADIAVLLDILSFNTFQNSFYLNMALTEEFLDSAQLRDSVVSRAKELNYTPRSARSASALVTLDVDISGVNTLELQKGTQFSAVGPHGAKTFVVATNRSYVPTSGHITMANVEIFEGRYTNEAYVVNSNLEGQRFVLSSNTIDITDLSVSVSNVAWSKADTLYGVTATSNVYFIQGAEDSKYEIIFGDGVLGYRPPDGSVVLAQYRSCAGEAGNECWLFSLDTDLTNNVDTGTLLTTPSIVTVANSSGGSAAESIESIRFAAPRHYQTQERAVTASDYKDIVLENFPEVKDANAYGGEDSDIAAQYGRTFVAISTTSGHPLPQYRKDDVQAFLADRATIGITPIVVEPDYLYVDVSIVVHSDLNTTKSTPMQVEALVRDAVLQYSANSLERFNVTCRRSKLSSMVDSADTSILGSELVMSIRKAAVMPINEPYATSVKFNNAIQSGVTSSRFISLGKEYYLSDTIPGQSNPNRSLYKVLVSSTITNPVYSSIGTIDYSVGNISVGTLEISSFVTESGLYFHATTVSQDVVGKKNDVIEIGTTGISVTGT